MNVTEAAKITGVSKSTVYRWITEGRIYAVKVGRAWDIELDTLPIKGDEARATYAKECVIKAYKTLVFKDGGYVGLRRLRNYMGNYTRTEQDAALRALATDGRIRLIAEINQKTLTNVDRSAAFSFKGDVKNLFQLNDYQTETY